MMSPDRDVIPPPSDTRLKGKIGVSLSKKYPLPVARVPINRKLALHYQILRLQIWDVGCFMEENQIKLSFDLIVCLSK